MDNLKETIKIFLTLTYKVFLYGFAFIGVVSWFFAVNGATTESKETLVNTRQSTRVIALNIGEECNVYKTTAPTSRLLELEQESCEHCDEYDYDLIPQWQTVLQSEGYEFDDVDLMYFDETESRSEWLHTEYKCTEQYEIGYTVSESHEITVCAD